MSRRKRVGTNYLRWARDEFQWWSEGRMRTDLWMWAYLLLWVMNDEGEL
jgi:hypothetical protein